MVDIVVRTNQLQLPLLSRCDPTHNYADVRKDSTAYGIILQTVCYKQGEATYIGPLPKLATVPEVHISAVFCEL